MLLPISLFAIYYKSNTATNTTVNNNNKIDTENYLCSSNELSTNWLNSLLLNYKYYLLREIKVSQYQTIYNKVNTFGISEYTNVNEKIKSIYFSKLEDNDLLHIKSYNSTDDDDDDDDNHTKNVSVLLFMKEDITTSTTISENSIIKNRTIEYIKFFKLIINKLIDEYKLDYQILHISFKFTIHTDSNCIIYNKNTKDDDDDDDDENINLEDGYIPLEDENISLEDIPFKDKVDDKDEDEDKKLEDDDMNNYLMMMMMIDKNSLNITYNLFIPTIYKNDENNEYSIVFRYTKILNNNKKKIHLNIFSFIEELTNFIDINQDNIEKNFLNWYILERIKLKE